MKLWLSRQHNDLYMLTCFKPEKEPIWGTDTMALWVMPSDPVGLTNLCEQGIWKLFGMVELKPLESIQVILEGSIRKRSPGG